MKFFGRELKFNDNRIYHEGDKPKPNEIGAAEEIHTHSTEDIDNLKNYDKSAINATGNLDASDTLNLALAKLENQVENSIEYAEYLVEELVGTAPEGVDEDKLIFFPPNFIQSLDSCRLCLLSMITGPPPLK